MDNLYLVTIAQSFSKTDTRFSDPDCATLFDYYPAYYLKVGYNPPWIGYVIFSGDKAVGCCGFVSKPVNNKVEIGYGTFKPFEGRGIATFGCRALVSMALRVNPALIITAKTLMEENASVKILKRNGFIYRGVVVDDDEGEVWEWVYQRPLQ